MHFTLIAGARPNFMKIAPIIHAIIKAQKGGHPIEFRLVTPFWYPLKMGYYGFIIQKKGQMVGATAYSREYWKIGVL